MSTSNKSSKRKTLLIFDGNNIAFRTFVIGDLQNSDGVKTNVLYGILNMTMTMLDKFDTNYFCYTWDYGKSQRRLAIEPTYKSGRHKDGDKLDKYLSFLKQVKLTQRFFKLFKFPQVVKYGIEADDWIAVISYWLTNSKHADIDVDVVIVSADKDMWQLISPRVSVYNPIQKKVYGFKNTERDFGYSPYQHLLSKCLTGDSSDSIKGVKGVGRKTAFMLVSKCKSFKEIFDMCRSKEHSHKAFARKILESKELLKRNYRLMRLPNYDGCLEDFEKLENIKIKDLVNETLVKSIVNIRRISGRKFIRVFNALEFSSFLSDKKQRFLKSYNIKLYKHGENNDA